MKSIYWDLLCMLSDRPILTYNFCSKSPDVILSISMLLAKSTLTLAENYFCPSWLWCAVSLEFDLDG